MATISAFSVYAPLLQLMYQRSDLSSTTTTVLSSASTPATSSGERTSSSGSQALSTADLVGIGVGVGLSIVVLAGAAYWFWRGRRKNSKPVATDNRTSAEPGGSEVKSPHELQGHDTVPEIDSRARLQEVQGEGVDGPRLGGGRMQQSPPVELA